MTVIAKVRRDKRKIWQTILGHILCKPKVGVFERDVPVCAVGLCIGYVWNRAVPDGVRSAVSSEVAVTGQTFSVSLPGFAGRLSGPQNIISGIRESAGVGIASVIVRTDQAPGHILIITNRRMRR